MNKVMKLLASSGLALTAIAGSAGAAAGAQAYDPNVARIANPANVCKSIPGTVAYDAQSLGIPMPDLSSFRYSDCVRTLAQGNAVVPPPFGDPYAQCDLLVNQFGAFSYPATLHNGTDPEDLLLPDLTVGNRKQCGNALYAFHYIADAVFPPGEG